MDNSHALVEAMAAKCREVVLGANEEVSSLPQALHPKHLLWMCDRIQKNSHGFAAEKLHRWLGFIQAAILANRMLNLQEIKAMFSEIKHSPIGVRDGDLDLTDHLDVDNSFSIDIGGQG